MRLANRALIAALAVLVLCAAVSAQTLRSPNDPRNQSPSVGTGGPEGGPTGLFTIYDGSTIRRGEFTFSIAYSNFDRDPGNVDITDIPASFNVGLNDHLELFFKMNAYRGIKVNTPQNLSSFYLPNTQMFFGNGLLGGAPAIILAPRGPNVGTLAGTAVFRPPFCPQCAPTGPLAVYYSSGQPLVAFLKGKIFEPLGMSSAGDCSELAAADASAYTRFALGPPRPVAREAAGWYNGAGELCMTASDLACS